MKFTVFSIFVFLSSASAMAATPKSPSAPVSNDRTMGVCHLVNSLGVAGRDDPLSTVYVISPSMAVDYYYSAIENKDLNYENDGKVTLMQRPEHGVLREEDGKYYRYTPVANYIGPDRATFMVEIGGLKVKVVYHFKAIDGGAIGGTEEEDIQNCPKGRAWKISLKLNDARSEIWA